MATSSKVKSMTIVASDIDLLTHLLGTTVTERAFLQFTRIWPHGYDTHKWGWRGFFETFPHIAGAFYDDVRQEHRRLRLEADHFKDRAFLFANLRYAHVTDSIFENCDLDWADASDAIFVNCAFNGTTWDKARLDRTIFIGCTGLDLKGATGNYHIAGVKNK